MVRIDDNALSDLDDLAVAHFSRFKGIPLLDGVSYHAVNSIVGRIQRRLIIDQNGGELLHVGFWNYLLANGFAKLERLIVGRPPELKILIGEINALWGGDLFSDEVSYHDASLTPFGKIVKDIFNYKLYRSLPECMDNCIQFGLRYCPYCNQQLVQVITEIDALTGDELKSALLQLDHFFPQSRHPYLSISFFNLVPGCSPCNAQIKLEKQFDTDTHFNPFDKRLDDYFRFKLKTLAVVNERGIEFEYENKVAYPSFALRDFRILVRYSDAHKRDIFRLVMACRLHAPKVERSLREQIYGLFSQGSKKRAKLVYNQNIPVLVAEINEVQIGKLKRDIAIQMGLL